MSPIGLTNVLSLPQLPAQPQIIKLSSAIGESIQTQTLGLFHPGAVQRSPGTLGDSAARILTSQLATHAYILASGTSGKSHETSLLGQPERSTTRRTQKKPTKQNCWFNFHLFFLLHAFGALLYSQKSTKAYCSCSAKLLRFCHITL